MKTNTKRIFCIAVIGGMICLTACGNSQNNSENSSSAEVVSAVESRAGSLLDSRVTLQAEAVAYDNGQLTFVYDGKEYTLAMDSELFEHDEKYVSNNKQQYRRGHFCGDSYGRGHNKNL